MLQAKSVPMVRRMLHWRSKFPAVVVVALVVASAFAKGSPLGFFW
jgi:hypothetical protein